MPDAILPPTRIGILFNPRSGHVRRHLNSLRKLASQVPRSTVIEVTGPSDIDHALSIFNLDADDLMVVIGGDGSLQAALTAALRRSTHMIPCVLALPAGTTNMSALDLGITMKPASALKALTKWLMGDSPAPQISSRPILQVCDATSESPQFGLFFGAGAIIDGVRYFHAHVSPKGIRGALGPVFAFLRMLLSLFNRNQQDNDFATSAGVQLPQHYMYSRWLLIFATTLDKLLLKSTPYWGHENAPMHFTAIAHRAPNLFFSLPSLLRGRPTHAVRVSKSYVSKNLTHVEIDGLSEYLLDGEVFPARSPLRLSAEVSARFVQFDSSVGDA